MFSKRNLDNFSERGQGERSRRYAVLRCISVCRTSIFNWFRQQPFWGVGRLRLSFSGSLEPRLGKCNDSRPFLYPYKFGEVLCRARVKLQKINIGVYMEELSQKLDPIMDELNRVYKEKYPNKGYLKKKIIDVPMLKTKKIQIFTIGETEKIESDVVFALERKNDGIAVESPLMDQAEKFRLEDVFEEKFLKRALEILESKAFENRLGLFYR